MPLGTTQYPYNYLPRKAIHINELHTGNPFLNVYQQPSYAYSRIQGHPTVTTTPRNTHAINHRDTNDCYMEDPGLEGRQVTSSLALWV